MDVNLPGNVLLFMNCKMSLLKPINLFSSCYANVFSEIYLIQQFHYLTLTKTEHFVDNCCNSFRYFSLFIKFLFKHGCSSNSSVLLKMHQGPSVKQDIK